MTKEEYASKLHLLQQEYDELREKCEQLEIDLEKKKVHSQEWCDKAMEAARDRQSVQQEYDKLKAYSKGIEGEFFDLSRTHHALKEKADKMADLLKYVRNNSRLSLFAKAEIDGLLSSYNSNTNNQNENNG